MGAHGCSGTSGTENRGIDVEWFFLAVAAARPRRPRADGAGRPRHPAARRRRRPHARWPGTDDPAGGVLDGAAGPGGAPRPAPAARAQPSASLSSCDLLGVGGGVAGGLQDDRAAGRAGDLDAAARCGISPPASGACRSRLDPAGSRLLLRCTRSIRPVIARTSSTAVARSQPAAQAWQVSSTKPAPNSPMRLPQPGDRVELAGHGVAAARGVLDEQRQREAAVLGLAGEGLAPVVDADRGVVRRPARGRRARPSPSAPIAAAAAACCGEQLAAGDADPVVGRGHVEHVGRVDDDQRRRSARSVLGVRPRLRVTCSSAGRSGRSARASASISAARASGPPSSSSLSSVSPGPTCTPIGCSATLGDPSSAAMSRFSRTSGDTSSFVQRGGTRRRAQP